MSDVRPQDLEEDPFSELERPPGGCSGLRVFPSHTGAFPDIFCDAMCPGVPAVTTMVDGIPSLSDAYANCLTIPARDSEILLGAVERVLEDVATQEREWLTAARRRCVGHLLKPAQDTPTRRWTKPDE
jgi:hypothetical protein